MDKNGIFGEMLERGQQTVASSVKTVASDVKNQMGFGKSESSPDNQGNPRSQGQQGNVQSQNQPLKEGSKPQAASTEETKLLVKEFYAPSSDIPENLPPETQQQMQQKDQIESQQKIANLRHELHKSGYYDPLIAYETKKEEGEEEDDNAAKRVEKQEQEEEQEKMELQEKRAKEDQDIATTRAQTKTEANRGAMG